MLETERILLRPWREEDAEALYRHACDPEVGPRAGWPPHKSVEESLQVIRTVFNNDHTWAIVLKDDLSTDRDTSVRAYPRVRPQTQCETTPIGCMGYYPYGESNIPIGPHDAEPGYWVARPYWNQGIATEALRLMIDYCFHVKQFQTLWCDYFVDNPASGRVMEKCGFQDTGQTNRLSHLAIGTNRPVKIMRLDKPTTPAMQYITTSNRIYIEHEGEELAEVTFPEIEPGIHVINHTYVSPTLRGQGVASELVRRAVEHIKAQGGTVRATCSYARAWLQRHPENI